jgi:hypothetical protein
MRSYIAELSNELRQLASDLHSSNEADLRIYARELARIEMLLQAARSLLEARLFEAEIDIMKAAKEKMSAV